MQRIFKATSLGVVTALLGAFVYFALSGFELEESLGLDTLFKARGPVKPPTDSVVVAIDKTSSDYFGLENEPSKWPRSYHTKLINELSSRGVKAIVFDVFFKEALNTQGDKELALAIKNAGNVILFGQLKRKILSSQGSSPQFSDLNNAINIERLIYPTEVVAKAPVAVAPFALPKYPQQVTQFWTFRVPAGEIPNMPALAFQLATLQDYQFLRQIIQKLIPKQSMALPSDLKSIIQDKQLIELISELRALFNENAGLAKSVIETISSSGTFKKKSKQNLLAMVKMYGSANQHYLNFYGPPRSITTIPFYEVISTHTKTQRKKTSFEFKDKVVFVGFSEFLQPEQKDNFYTVFSQESGLDISGVEIAATAFSNLLNAQTVNTLSPFNYIALIMLYGFVVAFVCRYLQTIPSVFVIILLASSYALLSYFVFVEYYFWLPWVVPLLIQSPFAIFTSLLWHYTETRREREQIRDAFGFYLPTNVVNKIAKDAGKVDTHQQKLYGICLATDAAQYTRMAEQMQPEELSQLVNNYYKSLFEPVRNHGGIISDVVGDAMLAIWSAPKSNVELRTQACIAALEINRVMNGCNQSEEAHLLPTRIGLHAGELMLGNVGAMDHFEYRAVGNIVNTSNRIENLNKVIGSQVIASESALAGVKGVTSRELGLFRLAGKKKSLKLYELLCNNEELDNTKFNTEVKNRCNLFAEALLSFKTENWSLAKSQFSDLIAQYENDKPAQFYMHYCDLIIENKLLYEWNGVIELDK